MLKVHRIVVELCRAANRLPTFPTSKRVVRKISNVAEPDPFF